MVKVETVQESARWIWPVATCPKGQAPLGRQLLQLTLIAAIKAIILRHHGRLRNEFVFRAIKSLQINTQVNRHFATLSWERSVFTLSSLSNLEYFAQPMFYWNKQTRPSFKIISARLRHVNDVSFKYLRVCWQHQSFQNWRQTNSEWKLVILLQTMCW